MATRTKATKISMARNKLAWWTANVPPHKTKCKRLHKKSNKKCSDLQLLMKIPASSPVRSKPYAVELVCAIESCSTVLVANISMAIRIHHNWLSDGNGSGDQNRKLTQSFAVGSPYKKSIWAPCIVHRRVLLQ